jgi:hypothetical protein
MEQKPPRVLNLFNSYAYSSIRRALTLAIWFSIMAIGIGAYGLYSIFMRLYDEVNFTSNEMYFFLAVPFALANAFFAYYYGKRAYNFVHLEMGKRQLPDFLALFAYQVKRKLRFLKIVIVPLVLQMVVFATTMFQASLTVLIVVDPQALGFFGYVLYPAGLLLAIASAVASIYLCVGTFTNKLVNTRLFFIAVLTFAVATLLEGVLLISSFKYDFDGEDMSLLIAMLFMFFVGFPFSCFTIISSANTSFVLDNPNIPHIVIPIEDVIEQADPPQSFFH